MNGLADAGAHRSRDAAVAAIALLIREIASSRCPAAEIRAVSVTQISA